MKRAALIPSWNKGWQGWCLPWVKPGCIHMRKTSWKVWWEKGNLGEIGQLVTRWNKSWMTQ